ncbi:unnamed protein product [Cyprideis torosa]|uniref:Uncharacterized protein n=1 Tax=Cyprideis torosa TaxID=163714 RepID=A0A7R8W1G4_9CRUS|nr:unnamed protein product [Cyprideis torosa]CAG0879776.1 unnamed protein product [Cyprideis torosa]
MGDSLLAALWIFGFVTQGTWSAEFSFIYEEVSGDLDVFLDGVQLLSHTVSSPAISLVDHAVSFEENIGNWLVSDEIRDRKPLLQWDIEENGGVTALNFFNVITTDTVRLLFASENSSLSVEVIVSEYNALTLHLFATAEEKVFGGGEQFSYLNLRGRAFPIWVREGGIGRGSSISSIVNETEAGAAGDYHTTYFPSAFYATTRGLTVRETTSDHDYLVLDFSDPTYHEIYVFREQNTSNVLSLSFTTSPEGSIKEALKGFWAESASQKWRQGIPEWVSDGLIISVQRGTEEMLRIANLCVDNGIPVAAMWIQDWSGRVVTSLGSRVFWNWRWNSTWYSELDTVIPQLQEELGIRVTAYINPYLNTLGDVYSEAESLEFLLKDSSGNPYLQDHGGFTAGTVDLLNPQAKEWYKDLIKVEMMELGLSGWMADFGEYTPIDASTAVAEGRRYHQLFPSLWAEANGEVLLETGTENDILIWMRSGLQAGGAALQPTLWTGDQNVDFTPEDGFPSAITGGNQPTANVQIYDDPELMSEVARLVNVFVLLKGYTRRLINEYLETGFPLLRPLLLEFPEWPTAWDVAHQYMYGESLLVTPITTRGVVSVELSLPPGNWEALWTGERFEGPIDSLVMYAPIGYLPVMILMDTVSPEDYDVFLNIRELYGYVV